MLSLHILTIILKKGNLFNPSSSITTSSFTILPYYLRAQLMKITKSFIYNFKAVLIIINFLNLNKYILPLFNLKEPRILYLFIN